jgi:hypothetical protein
MEITIQDYAGTFATNKVILNANGSEKIQGSTIEGRINTNNATAVLIYQDAIKGWTSQDVELDIHTISWATPTGQSLTYSTPSPQSSTGATGVTFPTTTFTATKAGEVISGTANIAGLPSGITAAQTITGSGAGNILTVTLTGVFPSTDSLNTALTLSGLTVDATVDYLVVAGGGGGGRGSNWYSTRNGGAGGAGGLRTSFGSTSGGGSSSETSLNIIDAANYTVTVGAGGAGGTGNTSYGAVGSDSVFMSITSNGGGRGAQGTTGAAGGNGGSGGGGDVIGVATANQGFNGGLGFNSGEGGGGGGASEAGNTDGNMLGGDGLAVSITGSSVTYAGGGSAGNYNGGSRNPGGDGGGGDSGYSSIAALPGTNNLGGGGGASGMDANGICGDSASGGSGVVILRYPNSKTITNPGSGLTFTTATVGSDKVTTFTAGTGNIQFN